MNRKAAMKKIQNYKFALQDAILFLDTHPDNQTALEYFNQMQRAYLQAVQDYEQNFGPITADDGDLNPKRWEWVDGPWPWQKEVNNV